MNRSMVAVAAIALAAQGIQAQAAGFVEDSKGTLTLRNFYFDRDFRSGSGQSQAQEWAQGFILRMDSGYTEGPVGFGLNLVGMAGFKLDSSPDRTGTGLLAYDPRSREVGDEYSKLGVTLKLKASRSELQAGTVAPMLPIVFPVAARLFQPLYRGAYLRSGEFDKLTLHAGYFDQTVFRDSTNRQDMTVSSPNRRFNGAAGSDLFTFAGGDYRWSENLTGSYYYANLEDLYEQHYAGLLHFLPLGDARLKTDLRYFHSEEDGAGRAGPVDNDNLNLMFTYLRGGHALGLGYMHLRGDTGMPYLSGTDPFLIVAGALASEYLNPEERTWQVKYDYDFAALGVPGLTAMVRYIRGDNVDLPGLSSRGKERERDIELAYVVQSGALQGLALRLRQGNYRSDFARDIDELRINVDYTLALW